MKYNGLPIILWVFYEVVNFWINYFFLKKTKLKMPHYFKMSNKIIFRQI